MLRRGLVASRSEAQRAIEEGRVLVRGVSTPKAASLVGTDSPIEVDDGGSSRYVSRGGLKLEWALDEFGVDPVEKRCLDAGASTGGFTDCLLQRGADRVCAVDVGYGQLDWSIRQDPRVEVHDRTNLRYAAITDLDGPFALIVADLSFISLCTVGGALANLATDGADLVLLVKPQFELGKGEVGKGGIVREAEDHSRAIRQVIACLDGFGLGTFGITPSPIRGAKGNREFFVHLRPGSGIVTEQEIEEMTRP
jgi:23S rRNA (cytidine1920-2'-O)/16S rRNA (cytidine1409-2'-O)-methyltransferase